VRELNELLSDHDRRDVDAARLHQFSKPLGRPRQSFGRGVWRDAQRCADLLNIAILVVTKQDRVALLHRQLGQRFVEGNLRLNVELRVAVPPGE
jgi:hypothetical protein